MIASKPSTPVVAAAKHKVPLYDVPVIPTLPVEKLEAIDDIDMAVMIYIGLLFSEDIFGFGPDA